VTFFVYRAYKFRGFPKLIHCTIKTITMVMELIAFAAAFGSVMAMVELPQEISNGLLPLSSNKYAAIIMANLCIGLITPPVGSVLFVSAAVNGLKIEEVLKSTMPFFIALFIVLMLVAG
jgi:TRAP-type C4-dicarboxylate transport system permease large subunit